MQHNFRRNRKFSVGESGASDIDPIVKTWASRVLNNGGASASMATQQALTTFVQGLTTNNLISKMLTVNCFVPDNLTAALTPLIKGSCHDLWVNHSFVPGDLSVNGLRGDGSTKFVEIGAQGISTWGNVTSSCGFSYYIYLNPSLNSASPEDIVINDGTAGTQLGLMADFVGQTFFDAFSSNAGSGRISANNPCFRGYISGNYKFATFDGTLRQIVYTARPETGHITLVSGSGATNGGFSNRQMYFFAGNVNGVTQGNSPKTYSFFAIHYGLTQAESIILYNLIIQLRTSLGGGYINPDPVIDWSNRVLVNSGTYPSASTQNALRTFYNGLVSNNLISKMQVINPVVPDNLSASLTPFWNVGGSADLWVNHNFSGSDLSVNGLVGDGIGKYLDTGFVPNLTFPSTSSAGLTVYVFSISASLGESEFGVTQTPSQAMIIYPNFSGLTYLDLFSQTGGAGRISGSNASVLPGYFSGNRGSLTGSVIEAIYTGSSTRGHGMLVSSSTSGGSLPTTNMYAMAQNNAGSAAQFTKKRVSFFAIHQGLTPTESSNFYTLVQQLRTNLGGGFV